MKILKRPATATAKRASSPGKEDRQDVTDDGRSVEHKKARFISPFALQSGGLTLHNRCEEQIRREESSRADPSMVDMKLEPGAQTSNTDCSGNCALPTTPINVKFADSFNNQAHGVQKSSTRYCEYQGTGMPGFGGILEDIDKIRTEDAASVEQSESRYNPERDSSVRSALKDSGASGIASERKNQTIKISEESSKLEGHAASCNLPMMDVSFGVCKTSGAAGKRFNLSKFKIPAFKAPEMSQREIGTHAPPQLLQSPNYPPKFPVTAGKANEICQKTKEGQSEYYCVMYCTWKPNTKRKGPWSDGVLVCSGRSFVLQDTDGKTVSRDREQRSKSLSEGDTLIMGKFEVELMTRSTEEAFLSGKIFLGTADGQSDATPKIIPRRVSLKGFQAPSRIQASVPVSVEPAEPAEPVTPVVVPKAEPSSGEGDLVLNAKEISEGGAPVIVDPYIALKLRPHQRDGVKFMYECVMGLKNPCFTGCLLADAMGLGKTLQVIALIWTLIKQVPRGQLAAPKVLVICPSSLVENWAKEVRKWLGNERLVPLIIHSGTSAKDAKRKLSSFQLGNIYHLLITSYELLRKHRDELKSAKPGLLVCDEAHRLKNCAGNKTIESLVDLECSKRLILTGTPIQNDLLEFYAMIDFVNPNLLGSLLTFKRLYAIPIERSRDRDASEKEKILGSARSAELQSMTRFCILQRTADVNSKYLSAKTEFVVFCKLQPHQLSLYQTFLRSKYVRESLESCQPASVLSAIGKLRKLCNHPKLVEHILNEENGTETTFTFTSRVNLKGHPLGRASADWKLSGKLFCLERLLSAVHNSSRALTKDKMVVVSNFTQTLDIIQILCEGQGWRWLRLDGATDVSQRQPLVDRFNANHTESVFLLSSKAGGSGLNLIGANRLVLFDPDWNPATDAQAMARIWRDGQKKNVVIYRLLTTGSIEEKIYQRQIMKGDVAAAVESQIENGLSGSDRGGRRHFSREELRELFTLDVETNCDTYDLLSQAVPSGSERWEDHSKEVDDHPLQEAVKAGVVTFVYRNLFKEALIVPSLENADADENEAKSTFQREATESETSQPKVCPSEVLIDEPVTNSGPQISSSATSHIEDERFKCLEREPLNKSQCSLSTIEKNTDDSVDDSPSRYDDHIANPMRINVGRIAGLTTLSNDEPCMDNSVKGNFNATTDHVLSFGSIWKERETVGVLEEQLEAHDPIRTVFQMRHNPQEHLTSNSSQSLDPVIDLLENRPLEGGIKASMRSGEEHETMTAAEQQHSLPDYGICNPLKMESDAEEMRNVIEHGINSDAISSDSLPADICHASEVSNCLFEDHSQAILKLLVADLPVQGDDFNDNDLEILDAPFLCNLDVEIEMRRANFTAKDLWQGFKHFACGFLLGENEQQKLYKECKLGMLLDRCNLDRTADEESVFCKGLPFVRAALRGCEGEQAADITFLYSKHGQDEHVPTNSLGRFVADLMRLLEKLKSEGDSMS